jgi:two-component system OmpR family sensor kinase
MSRIPLRLRLTLAFAGVMAIVLAATGAFLYLRLGASLDDTIDDGLRARAADVAALVRQEGSGLGTRTGSRLETEDDSFAQVVDSRGEVVDSTLPPSPRPVLGTAEISRARAGPAFFRTRLPEDDEEWRVLATPVEGQGVVVVGTSLEERGDALEGLLAQLLIGGPLALLLASLAGYGVATAALRPVESMRRRAAAISGAEPQARLPVPEARDEIRRLGETLNGMLARLEQAIARERSFVADASHELRTPLALLRTELELALRRPRSAEELERALRSAAEETDRLSQLAEDLLVLARSDQGRLSVRSAPVRVREILDGVGERFARRGAISVHAPDDLELHGDQLRLEQALGNLVDNALRHGRGEVRLLGRDEDGHVTLHVTDEGPGFPPDFLPRAFERFARVDEARSSGGAGLGLAIVDVIARAHRGSAYATNGPERGAHVWLSIPKRGAA